MLPGLPDSYDVWCSWSQIETSPTMVFYLLQTSRFKECHNDV